MNPFYLPTWNSLRAHQTPQWFKDAKFGIYTHWGIYSVPARGYNVTWYPYYMYRDGSPQYEYHVQTYGGPSQFGYKDFIPMFTAEKFDPDEWAELFRKSGAQFAGPVGEHHDGFAMWDTRYSEWNAARMGPRRDVVAELEKAIRKQNLRFMVSLHHAENWWYYPHWRKDYDTSDPRYSGFYGEIHNTEWAEHNPETGKGYAEWVLQDKPSQKFLDAWLLKTQEIIDRFQPDLLWFDNGLQFVQEHYKREALAYYFNRALEWGWEVVANFKWNDIVPGPGVLDIELGRYDALAYHEWLADTTVDDGHGWAYMKDAKFKPASTLVHYLIDCASKNGCLLLNIGPKPDGEIPEQPKSLLAEIGKWLAVNGEAIYGTTPWMTYGEGPTKMIKSGYFMEDQEVKYTAQDFRFTAKDDVLYAICLGWPAERVTIQSLKSLYPAEIASVRMLGSQASLEWSLTPEGLTIQSPPEKPCEFAYAFKIVRRNPFHSENH